MFEYQAIPGRRREAGEGDRASLFRPSAFPAPRRSPASERETERGPVQVPGLGDPNVRESNSRVCGRRRESQPRPRSRRSSAPACRSATRVSGGSSPSGVLATADRVFVSNARQRFHHRDRRQANQVEAEIPIRIPGLETLRGVLPVGLGVSREVRLAAGGRGRASTPSASSIPGRRRCSGTCRRPGSRPASRSTATPCS